MKKLTLVFLAACLPLGVWAATADHIAVADPYVRLVPSGATTTAAFMVLKNNDTRDVKLIKAESSVSQTAELHTHLNENGVMKMRQIPEILIKAKGETVLQPGGLHIMLINLKAPLKEGEKVNITLDFDDGSHMQVEAPVRTPMPMMTDQEHMKAH
jgi:copper(I)-binding protein